MEAATSLGELGARLLKRPNHEGIRPVLGGGGQGTLAPLIRHFDGQNRVTDFPEDGFVDLLVRGSAEVLVEPVHGAQATSAV